MAAPETATAKRRVAVRALRSNNMVAGDSCPQFPLLLYRDGASGVSAPAPTSSLRESLRVMEACRRISHEQREKPYHMVMYTCRASSNVSSWHIPPAETFLIYACGVLGKYVGKENEEN